MGVKNLWKLLKESDCCTDIAMDWATMHGKILAVDLSFWIVEASTAMQHVRKCDATFKPHLRNLFFRIKHLMSLGIRLIFVFDGSPPPQKFLELQRRGVLGNINRRNKMKKYEHSAFGRQCKECKQLLTLLGIPFVNLKIGEAEAFAAKLNHFGIVSAVLTPDGDSFLFGAKVIFTQYHKNDGFIKECNVGKSGMSQRLFIALGLLLGTDYVDGCKGIGHKRAHKLILSAMSEMKICQKTEDELDFLLKICKMEADDIYFHNIPNKKIEKFITLFRKSYDNLKFLEDVIGAYLSPCFDASDERKLYDKEWIAWKCPNFGGMREFIHQKFKADAALKNMMQHTLDYAMDAYLFGFIDGCDARKFELGKIIKMRTKNKIKMYSVEWMCTDDDIKREIAENEMKCEGLHFAEAVEDLHPLLVQEFEVKNLIFVRVLHTFVGIFEG